MDFNVWLYFRKLFFDPYNEIEELKEENKNLILKNEELERVIKELLKDLQNIKEMVLSHKQGEKNGRSKKRKRFKRDSSNCKRTQ